MVADLIAEFGDRYSPPLIRFVVHESEKSAEAVARYLDHAGLAPPAGEKRGFPPGMLLDLGGIMRLREWEAAGTHIHLEAGLPTAREAMHDLIVTLESAAADPDAWTRLGRLARSVFALVLDRFAWNGPTELNAEIVLDVPDEDALVEAMARFLMAERHRSLSFGASP